MNSVCWMITVCLFLQWERIWFSYIENLYIRHHYAIYCGFKHCFTKHHPYAFCFTCKSQSQSIMSRFKVFFIIISNHFSYFLLESFVFDSDSAVFVWKVFINTLSSLMCFERSICTIETQDFNYCTQYKHSQSVQKMSYWAHFLTAVIWMFKNHKLLRITFIYNVNFMFQVSVVWGS